MNYKKFLTGLLIAAQAFASLAQTAGSFNVRPTGTDPVQIQSQGVGYTVSLKPCADGKTIAYSSAASKWICADSGAIAVVGTVQPTPSATGNTANLNSAFKDANGDTWIVDKSGNAIKAGSAAPVVNDDQELTADNAGSVTVTVTPSTVVDSAGGSKINYTVKGSVKVDGTTITEDPTTHVLSAKAETITSVTGVQATGHTIGTYNAEDATATPIKESVTALSLSGSTLTFKDENGASTDLTLPSGGSSVSVTQTVTSGTELATVTVNGVPTKIYAPVGKTYAQTVYTNGPPSTASIFDLNNPPATNDDTLKKLDNAIYIDTTTGLAYYSDGSAYFQETAPNNTEWWLTATSTDAGGNKATAIHRTGSATIDNGFLRAINAGTTNAFTVDPTDAVGPKLKLGTTADFGLFWEMGAYNGINNFDNKSRDFKIFNAGNANALMVKAGNGYVGISNGAPSYHLDVSGGARIAATPITTVATYMLVKHPITGQISEQLINPVGGDDVFFNGTDPATATIFDDVNPPVANDNTLKNVSTNTYRGTDGSVWTWNGTAYVTKTFAAQGEADQFSATVGQTSFTLTSTPKGKVWLFRNGARLPNASFSVVGTTVTYVPANNGSATLGALVAGDVINIDYVK